MPSGAKKRKAAKKKKEKETNTNPSTNNPQGDNELKSQSQDEKGSDGGEGGSPAYGDHDHSFNEEVEESEPSAAQPPTAVAKSVEEVPSDDKIDEAKGGNDGVVVIEWDMKYEDSCKSKGMSVVHIDSAKESDYGKQSSGGSNDETVTLKNTQDDEPCKSEKESQETVAFDELVKSIDSSHATMTLITQNAQVEETVNSAVESSADSVKAMTSVSDSEVKSRDAGNALLEKSMGSQGGATDLAVKKSEDKVYPFSDQDVRASSLEEPKPKEFDNNVSVSVSHNPIPESTNVAEPVKDSDTPECSENQPLVASAPHMVQKTSWLNCCGLFEVLSSSR
ncbi:hypothetical protein SESBI_02273 [Sesbania bispinosa]|nr:hypothetical protein SESBI_02273 [Sesbania bispinosa]